MHAVDFLKLEQPDVPAVVVLHGAQWRLKQQTLARLKTLAIGDDESSLTRFAGKEVDLQTVADELRTVSMWGDRRFVQVDDADEFVSKHRAGLEKYVEAPAKKSVLVLDVASWPKNTRIAKQVAQSGLDVECSELKGAALSKWLVDTARAAYGVALQRDAAALLSELIGEDLGVLDQELSKLASFVGARKSISAEDVRGLVGGWKTETTWALTDGVRDGRLGDALVALDQLLASGEAPLRLLGGIGFVYRKLAYATELARSQALDQALRSASVFPRDVGPATAYLRRIGRAQAEKILAALVETDAGLKGSSRLPERIQLERLLLRLSGAVKG